MPRHRADREIPPRKVGGYIRHKAHPVRMAAVRVAAVRTESRDLQRAVRGQQRQRAVLEPGFEHPLTRKHCLHLLRLRGGT